MKNILSNHPAASLGLKLLALAVTVEIILGTTPALV